MLLYLLVIKGKENNSESAVRQGSFFHSSVNNCDRKRPFWFAAAEVTTVHRKALNSTAVLISGVKCLCRTEHTVSVKSEKIFSIGIVPMKFSVVCTLYVYTHSLKCTSSVS